MDGFRSGTTTTRGTGRRLKRRAGLIALALTGAIALFGPASAHALALDGLSAAPADTQAGANSDFTLAVGFDSDDVENLRISLPPGMVGDPGATPMCTPAQLHASTPACPAASQVGSTTVNATVTVAVLPVTLDIQGKIYNLEPQPGEPARFGIVLTPIALDPLPPLLPVVLEAAVELRQTDFGLDTVVADIPNSTQGLPTHINSMSMTLDGEPAQGTKPFMRNPTSCGPAVTRFTADAYGSDTEVTGEASFTPTGCENVPFHPGFSAVAGAPGATSNGQHTPVTTIITQEFNEAGLKDATVQMPNQLQPDLNRLALTCDPADFVARTCPESSVLGPARASSPLLSDPLTGKVILVDQPVGLPRIGVDLVGQLSMQVYGDLALTNTVSFAGLPDIPISEFQLGFDGGPNGLVTVAGDLCQETPVLGTTFVGHNGATQTGSTAASVDGCTAGAPAPATAKKAKKKCKKPKGKKKAKKKKKRKCKRKKRKRKRR